ncbi:LOW QUALITY PROTEIN: neurotensin receptor type 2 [Erethizon dorsatum]
MAGPVWPPSPLAQEGTVPLCDTSSEASRQRHWSPGRRSSSPIHQVEQGQVTRLAGEQGVGLPIFSHLGAAGTRDAGRFCPRLPRSSTPSRGKNKNAASRSAAPGRAPPGALGPARSRPSPRPRPCRVGAAPLTQARSFDRLGTAAVEAASRRCTLALEDPSGRRRQARRGGGGARAPRPARTAGRGRRGSYGSGDPGTRGPRALLSALYALPALGAAGNELSAPAVLKGRPALGLLLLLLLRPLPVELYSSAWGPRPGALGDLGCRAPHLLHELWSTRHGAARRLLSLVWVASLGLALPTGVIVGQKRELETLGGEPEPESRMCTVLVSRATPQVFIQMNVLVSFVLPLALTAFLNGVTVNHLVALYSQVPSASAPVSSMPGRLELLSEEGLLGLVSWRKTFSGRASLVRHKHASQICSLQQSARVLRAIVAVYVICWMPHHACRFMFCYVADDAWTDLLYDFYRYLYMVTNILFYVGCANPVLYNITPSSFWKLFLGALTALCWGHLPMGAPEPPPMDAASASGDPPRTLTWMRYLPRCHYSSDVCLLPPATAVTPKAASSRPCSSARR